MPLARQPSGHGIMSTFDLFKGEALCGIGKDRRTRLPHCTCPRAQTDPGDTPFGIEGKAHGQSAAAAARPGIAFERQALIPRIFREA